MKSTRRSPYQDPTMMHPSHQHDPNTENQPQNQHQKAEKHAVNETACTFPLFSLFLRPHESDSINPGISRSVHHETPTVSPLLRDMYRCMLTTAPKTDG